MKKIEEASFFYEISETLNEHLDLKKSLYKVLDILANSLDMARGTITLLDPVRNEIRIEVAHGITQRAMQQVKYKLGEGITGGVIQSGKAVSIPKISEEPKFLNRTVSRRTKQDLDLSFICVPIKKGRQVMNIDSVEVIEEAWRDWAANYAMKPR